MFRRRAKLDQERSQSALERVAEGEWPVEVGQAEADQELQVAHLLHGELAPLRKISPPARERAWKAIQARTMERGLWNRTIDSLSARVFPMGQGAWVPIVLALAIAILGLSIWQVAAMTAEPVGGAVQVTRTFIFEEARLPDGSTVRRLVSPTTVMVDSLPQGWRIALARGLEEIERFRDVATMWSSRLFRDLPDFLPWRN